MPPVRFFLLRAGVAALATMLAPRLGRAQSTPVLTLAEVERAAQQQPQMLIARAATNIAEGQAEQARSPLLPQVTPYLQYTRETGNIVPRPGLATSTRPTSITSTQDYWQIGVGVNQLVYDFGQTWQRYRAADKFVEAQRLSERTTQLQVTFAVRRAYFGAGATKDLVGVAQEALDDQARHLIQVQGFVDAGTQPEIALAQQKAAVANAEVVLISAQNNYQTAKALLNQAAGLVGGTAYDVGNDALGPVVDEDQGLQPLAARALATRPEMAAFDKLRESQEDTLASARGGYGPTVGAVAGAAEGGIALDSLVPNWYAGVVVNWPIYQGGLTKGQVHAAAAAVQSVNAQRSLEALQVRLDVDSARLAVRAAKATIPSADAAVINARERLRLAEERYVAGVGSIIELNDAEVFYVAARAQAVQARFSLSSSRAQLLAALGRVR
jgi:outer membrane protein